ncbi:MAG: hypothetical protein AAF385_04315 [Pseudomonadota bacterium]
MRTRIGLILGLLIGLGGCTSNALSEAEYEAKIDQCLKDAILREGESLDTGFQSRAARAHCEKIISRDRP